MAKYKDLHGIAIKAVSTDPSNAPSEGQVWYNTNTGAFKSILLSEAWSSGTALSTGRYNLAGSGTGAAGLVAGGTTPGIVTNTEHYNGTGWRNGGALNVGRDSATMFGLSTAATFVGGYAPSPNGFRSLVEEYNGSTWSEETDMPAPRAQGASAGTQTDGIVFGGNQGPPGSPETTATTTLEYNGSSWTTGGAMSVNDRYIMGCGGSQAQALRVGGESDTDATEEYDGSSWTTGGNLNTGRNQGAASGTNTAGLVFGGNPNRTNTEGYDGTSWSNKPALATGVEDTSGSAQGTNAEAFQAGQSASPISIVQNWNSAASVVTAGAFASSGSLGTARSQIAGFGATTDASIGAGGYRYGPNAYTNASEEYNGSTFSATPNMPVSLGFRNAGGTVTAGIVFGGHDNTSPANTSLWDGSSYSNGPNIVDSGYGTMGNGSQTAAFMCGSASTPERPNSLTEEYNGSSWSSVPATLNTARGNGMGVGSQTAGLAIGGGSPSPVYTNMEEYDGSTWTNGHTLVVGASRSSAQGGSAPQDNTMIAAGGASSAIATAQQYNGTAWSTSPSLSTARLQNGMGAGSDSSSMIVAGGNSPSISTSEKFTGETTALNVKTLTRS